MIVSHRYIPRLPGPLLALIVGSLLQHSFHFENVPTLGSTFGKFPQHLPAFHVPDFRKADLLALIHPAFTIALLGAIESLLSASSADHLSGTRHHANQELIGQGIANLLAPLFGGFAATGAIARTSANIANGGNSPLAGIVHAVFFFYSSFSCPFSQRRSASKPRGYSHHGCLFHERYRYRPS